jgi:TonB family protein
LRVYYQIERVIQDFYDNDPIMTVQLLRERSKSLRVQDSGEGVSLGTLSDALDILRGMPDPPPLLMAEVLVEMGDWYVEYSRSRIPVEHYLQAWDLLGLVEDGENLRRQWFDEQVAISMGSLSQRDLTEDPNAPEGYVVVYYTVHTSGRPQAVEITDSDPPGLKDSAVLRLIQSARFRPRIQQGEIVAVRRASRFSFRYLPPEEE